MSIFILAYAIGADRLVWREIFQNNEDDWRETVHAITVGIAEATLAGAWPRSQSWERRPSSL